MKTRIKVITKRNGDACYLPQAKYSFWFDWTNLSTDYINDIKVAESLILHYLEGYNAVIKSKAKNIKYIKYP